jgi:hypothetical protein
MDNATQAHYINARRKEEEGWRKEARKKAEEDARKKAKEGQSSKGLFSFELVLVYELICACFGSELCAWTWWYNYIYVLLYVNYNWIVYVFILDLNYN